MDLTTRYLGLALKNPLIASASPLTLELDNIRRLEDNGAAAIVLPSIFEEQIKLNAGEPGPETALRAENFAATLPYFPPLSTHDTKPHSYLNIIRRARSAVSIPVIASLNGITPGGWIDYARLVEQAGASAIELNAYFIASDLALSGRQVEQAYVDILKAVKASVSIPVAMKLSPYFSAMGNLVRELDHAGANGVTLFNRFFQPDIDLSKQVLHRDLNLSHSSEMRLPLLWIGVLAGKIDASIAASTGVETSEQVVKYLLVGADTVMTTTSLMRHGIGHMKTLRDGLVYWLKTHDLESVNQIRGKLSRGSGPAPTPFERANYIRTLPE